MLFGVALLATLLDMDRGSVVRVAWAGGETRTVNVQLSKEGAMSSARRRLDTVAISGGRGPVADVRVLAVSGRRERFCGSVIDVGDVVEGVRVPAVRCDVVLGGGSVRARGLRWWRHG